MKIHELFLSKVNGITTFPVTFTIALYYYELITLEDMTNIGHVLAGLNQ